jgi:hypothetical protein
MHAASLAIHVINTHLVGALAHRLYAKEKQRFNRTATPIFNGDACFFQRNDCAYGDQHVAEGIICTTLDH